MLYCAEFFVFPTDVSKVRTYELQGATYWSLTERINECTTSVCADRLLQPRNEARVHTFETRIVQAWRAALQNAFGYVSFTDSKI